MERRYGHRPQRVLIVDDSSDIREMWRLWLTFWGFQVDEAQNGHEALDRARSHRPDLVLMDLWMPVLDGLAATERLKADPATAQVPVLALSAYTLPSAVDRALAAGCDSFLPKPVDPDHLLEKIRQMFGQRAALARSEERPSDLH